MAPATMRAKFRVGRVEPVYGGPRDPDVEALVAEQVTMYAVTTKDYDETGLDEDNTFAHYTPYAELNIEIANPALFGKLEVGDYYYADFTKVENPTGD